MKILQIGFCLIVSCVAFQCGQNHVVTDLVYFDIDIDSHPSGRIIFGLFGKVVPKTVENFVRLAVHDKGFGYTQSRFISMRRKYFIVGGSLRLNNNEVSNETSWFGAPFPPENFKLQHYGPGWISMTKNPDAQIESTFFVITNELYGMREWFDGRYVVFGVVVHGMSVVHQIEYVETFGYAPRRPVTVRQSGTLKLRSKLEIQEGHITKDFVSATGKML